MSAYNTLMNLTGGFNKQAADPNLDIFGVPLDILNAQQLANENISLSQERKRLAEERAALAAEEARKAMLFNLQAQEAANLRAAELAKLMAELRNNDNTTHNMDVLTDVIKTYGKRPDADPDTVQKLGWTAARLKQMGEWSPELNEAIRSALGETGFWSDFSNTNKNNLAANAGAVADAVHRMYNADADAFRGEGINGPNRDVKGGINLFNQAVRGSGGFVNLVNDPRFKDVAHYYTGDKPQLQGNFGFGDEEDLFAVPNTEGIMNVPHADATQEPNVKAPLAQDNYEDHVPDLTNPLLPLVYNMPTMQELSTMQPENSPGGPDKSIWQNIKETGSKYGKQLLNWLQGKHINMMNSGYDVPNWALALGALGIGGLGAYGIKQYMKSREEEEYYERMRRLMAQQALMKSGAARAMSAVDKTEGPTLPLRPTLNERSSLARLMEITRTRGLQNVDFGQKGMSSVKSAAASVMKAKDPDEKGNMEQRPTLRPESSLQKLLRITQTHTSK